MMTENNNNKIISLVLVDTSVFRKADFDFIGVKSSRLLSFFSAVEEKDIQLLSHPILDDEIEKHILDSSICKNYNALIADLKKNKAIIEQNGFIQEDEFSKLFDYDIANQLIIAYRNLYKYSVELVYPDPQNVFELYFSCSPPFSATGKKKYEFPDAFVIEAVKSYLEQHQNEVLLVVSDDNDWEAAFTECDGILFCTSINEATNYINQIDSILDSDVISWIFDALYGEIHAMAQFHAECEEYDFFDYNFINGLEIDSVVVQDVSSLFDVLAISRDSIILGTTMSIKVSGEGEAVDEDLSLWSAEENNYLFATYGDVKITDGFVEAACEIVIDYDFEDPENSAYVTDFSIVDDTPLQIECNNVSFIPFDEDEKAIRILREDKGMSRRR